MSGQEKGDLVERAASTPRRVAIYTNVLTLAGQEERSVADQEAAGHTYAADRGDVVVQVYREDTEGGDDNLGPALSQLLADAGTGAFEAVIVTAPGLLGRDHSAAEFVARQLEGHGVRIESVESAPYRTASEQPEH